MKDQTETPATENNVVSRALKGKTDAPATVVLEPSSPAVADLEAELANLRLLIRRQDAVVERLLSERAATVAGDVTVKGTAPAAKRAKRSTRRGLLTQLAAGAAGVAAAAVYGSTTAGKASADFDGTVVGPSNAQVGILAYPPGITPITNAQTSNTAGVWGQRDNSAPNPGLDAGVIGISNLYSGVVGVSHSNLGVYAESASYIGLFAQTATSNPNYAGVVGKASTIGIGVHGLSGSGPGVKGESSSGPGVQGVSDSQPGVDGTSTNSLGLRGTSTNFVGIVGISTNSHGLYGSTNAGANGFGIVAENLGANGRGMLVTGGLPSQFYGGLEVFGPKNAVLKMQDGSFAAVYCQESPEPYFEDFGRAQLAGGVANVPLEREFATLVAGGDYHVFLTPEGAAQGMYVSRRSPTGFEVRDLGNGSASFSYRIVTRRKDIEGKRFARVSTEAAEKVAGVRAVLASMGTAGSPSPNAPQPGAPAPTPGFTVGPGLTVQQPGAAPSSAPHP